MSLVVDHLTKRFGSVVALDDLAFEVAPGQVFGFLGANGAGKTTTMRIALGVLEPDAGRVTWQGIESHRLPRSTWGYLPEERGLYPRMRVLDQLVFFAGLHGVPVGRAKREATAWLRRFRAEDLAERKAEQLSKGNQQKVQFIAAVLHDPAVLLMDEPFTGLDPVNVMLLREAFLELRDRGRTVVFSTHQMEVAEALCESVAIVDRGRMVIGGPVRDVKRATGRRLVRISVADDHRLPWLASVPGARVAQVGMDRSAVELDSGVEPEVILAAAVAAGVRVVHFEIADPSLEQVFIDHVGRPPDEELHLAPADGDDEAAERAGEAADEAADEAAERAGEAAGEAADEAADEAAERAGEAADEAADEAAERAGEAADEAADEAAERADDAAERADDDPRAAGRAVDRAGEGGA